LTREGTVSFENNDASAVRRLTAEAFVLLSNPRQQYTSDHPQLAPSRVGPILLPTRTAAEHAVTTTGNLATVH
jgi:hypothetical protein